MQILSVTNLILSVKQQLEGQFRLIHVQGEITNWSKSGQGHVYFSLSDQDSLVACALFRMDGLRNPLAAKLKDGDKVIVSGSIGVYTRRGTFQIIVKKITPVGKGDLKQQFERIKVKLAAKGYFDLDKKQTIPSWPKRIAVVTASQSAALQDFINVFKRRSKHFEILVIPSIVQGEAAEASLLAAMDKAMKIHQQNPLDVLVLTRGGGSLEDLWSFNSEKLAEIIYACPLPIVSAVGHQVDFTIADFVADLRAETPTAAAEILSEGQLRIDENLGQLGSRLRLMGQHWLRTQQIRLNTYHPQGLLEILWQVYTALERKLGRFNLKDRIYELTGLIPRQLYLDEEFQRLSKHMQLRLESYRSQTERCEAYLAGLSPQRVLERGYTYLQQENGRIVGSMKKFKQVKPDETLTIQFHDGSAKVGKLKPG